VGVKELAFLKRDQELPEELKDKRNLAAVDLLAGDYEKAEAVYDEIIKVVPKNGQIWLEYTHTLLGLGRKEEAKKAYQSVKKFIRKEESVFGIGNSRTMVQIGTNHGSSMLLYTRSVRNSRGRKRSIEKH